MTKSSDMVLAQPAVTMDLSGFDQQAESDPIISVLRRRWKMLLLVTACLATVSSAAVWRFVQPMFEVSAVVHIAPVVRPVLVADTETDISRQYSAYVATEVKAMTSPSVIAATLSTPEVRSLPSVVSSPNPELELASRLEATPVQNTHTVRVSMIGEHAPDMVVVVNNLLETYVRKYEERKREWDEKILSSLRREQTGLAARLETKSVELRQLAAEEGPGSTTASGSLVSEWFLELQQRLTEARQARALASARLAAFDAGQEADSPPDFVAGEFLDYLKGDPEWQHTSTRLRTLESEELDDERLGRGPGHPDVRGRNERIEMFRNALDIRETELRDLFAGLLRRRLQVELQDADVVARVLEETAEDFSKNRAQAARQAFLLEDLRHERERLETALAQVRQKVWSVEVEQNRMSRVTIEAPAIAPRTPNIDKRLKYTAAAFLMSLMLGAGVALARDRLDTSVRDSREVTRRLGMSLLGSIQYIKDRNGAALIHDERISEPMRGISTALLATPRSGTTRSRLITSPTAGSGKSSLALHLARSLSATGRRVLLVDADNRVQGVSHALNMAGLAGLKDVIEGTLAAKDAVQSCASEDFAFLPAGRRHDQFGNMLGRRRAQAELRALFQGYDEVIVDSPPVLATSDAIVLATLVDEVILILRAGKSTREEAQAARDSLAPFGHKLVGVILNAVNPKTAPYSYYGYAPAAGGQGMEA